MEGTQLMNKLRLTNAVAEGAIAQELPEQPEGKSVFDVPRQRRTTGFSAAILTALLVANISPEAAADHAEVAAAGHAEVAAAGHAEIESPTAEAYSRCSSYDNDAVAGHGVNITNNSNTHNLVYRAELPFGVAEGEVSPQQGDQDIRMSDLQSLPEDEITVTLTWLGHNNGADHTETTTLDTPAIPCPRPHSESFAINGEKYYSPAENTGGIDPGHEETCPADVPPAPFSDRPKISSSHVKNVDCAYSEEIVEGFLDGTYRPEVTVRRDQMAAYIARAITTAGGDLPETASHRFLDVRRDSVHADNINRLAAAGIVEGTSSLEFSPGDKVRRDQMASFLVRATEYVTGSDLSSHTQAFADVTPRNVHFANVNGASELGYTLGSGDGNYKPGEAVRRDQNASFVIRMWGYITRHFDSLAETEEEQAISYATATTWSTGGNTESDDTNEELRPFTEINERTVAVVDPDRQVNFAQLG
ncbi:hypothetical protein BH23PAT1_BH23PAT1_4450 [soil metagenome]